MKRRILQSLLTIALPLLLVPSIAPAAAQADVASRFEEVVRRPIPRAALGEALYFARTELYFGTAKPSGVVTEEEFRDFLDREITPRFPDGLTVLKGMGQFLGQDGTIVEEDSYVLILLYPMNRMRQSSNRMETIRRLYKLEFQQESVLRVDDSSVARVSF